MYGQPDVEVETVKSMMGLLEVLNDGDFWSAKLQFSSCNNMYLQWIFGRPEIQELYRLHNALAKQSGVYFKILKINPDAPSEAKDKLFESISKLATDF